MQTMLSALDRLVADTSSALMRNQADQVPSAVDETLSQIAEVLDIDCATLSVCAPGGKSFDVGHASERDGAWRALVDGLHALPWCAGQLFLVQPVVLPNLPQDLP